MLGEASISEGETRSIQSNREEEDKRVPVAKKKKKFIGKIASCSAYHIYRTGIYPVHFVKMSQKNSYSNGVTQIFRANTLYA